MIPPIRSNQSSEPSDFSAIVHGVGSQAEHTQQAVALKKYEAAYMSERGRKLAKLPRALREVIEKLVAELDQLSRDFTCYKESKDEQLKGRIQQELNELNKKYNDLIKSKTEYPIEFASGFFLSCSIMTVNDFIFAGEVTINRFLNKIVYEIEVMGFLENHRQFIAENFLADFPHLYPKDLVFRMNPASEQQETHNQGKSTYIITISSWRLPPDGFIRKIVFKPRDALIDQAIVETFKAINDLSLEYRSGSKKELPVYKIFSFPEMQVSLWEYVNGTLLKDHQPKDRGRQHAVYSAGDYIEQIEEVLSQRYNRKIGKTDQAAIDKLKAQLDRLDQILTTMQCSDLHLENVVLQGSHLAVKFVPIDLENLQLTRKGRRQPLSQLGGNPKEVELTDQEIVLIQQFKEKTVTIPFRHLLISTMTLRANPYTQV